MRKILRSTAVFLLTGALTMAALPTEAFAANDAFEKAKVLYQEGSTLYSAGDYNGAIEKFTEALKIITAEGSGEAEEYQIRGYLMLNIAKSHVNAYDVDRELFHLRQALSIYKRFVDESEKISYPPEEIEEAKAEMEKLATRIEEIEAAEKDKGITGTPVPVVITNENEVEATRAFGTGIGLTVAGTALVGSGIGFMVYGLGFEAAAQDQVIQEAGDPNHVFTPAEERFVEDEKNKGLGLTGGFAAVAALGIAGIGIGAWQISKARKLRRGAKASATVIPQFGTHGGGLAIVGRF
jgi:tetratricopeptide (TPR) repeat protein